MRLQDPLHREPTRPVLDPAGIIANPLREAPAGTLDGRAVVHIRDLEPDTSYRHGAFEYLTDGAALPARARGRLRLVPRGRRRRARAAQRSARVGSRLVRVHGGHLVAVSLGGDPSGPNLIPQQASVNQSAYARVENGWRTLTEGRVVDVDIQLTIDEQDPTTPSFILVTAWEDGEAVDYQLPIINRATSSSTGPDRSESRWCPHPPQRVPGDV